MKLAVILLTVLLSGCSTLEENFTTRVSCTLAKDEMHSTSFWWRLGITSKVDDRDRVVGCETKPAAPR